MYSTTDGAVTHLMNAMPAAQKNRLMILVGVWSGTRKRFDVEKSALQDVINQFGCGNIAAISVGNEDLYSVNIVYAGASGSEKDNYKTDIAHTLVRQISQVRDMVRSLGCCNVPVTLTDTWNEFSNTSIPGISEVCSNFISIEQD